MKRVAIVGIQGVPAKYGGFETLVENIIGENCSSEIQYTVFCSSKDMPSRLAEYKGVRLKYVPLRANGMQSIPYDMWSMCRVLRGYDTVLVLGTSGCMFLPVLRLLCRSKLIVNIDGLEHRRDKWGRFARWFLRLSEKMAVRFADVIIADNKGIQDYVRETYHKNAELIAYGGDHVLREISDEKQQEILQKYGLAEGDYALSICRIEPENNCHLTLEAFAESNRKLVFIGNWEHSEYARNLFEKYKENPYLRAVNSLYDLDALYVLRSCAGMYVHGHSAGGTNPSLVEAMFFGCPILAYDVVYNRETTENRAYYYANSEDLKKLILSDDLSKNTMREIAECRYTWAYISKQYENLY